VAQLGYKPSCHRAAGRRVFRRTGVLSGGQGAYVSAVLLRRRVRARERITLLQVAANPYISLLGEPRGASSRLTLAQAREFASVTLSRRH